MTAPRPTTGPATGPASGRWDLALLTAGVAVSTAGDAAALTALSVQLRAEGAGWVAALLGAELVPVVLLAPLAGRLVDRFENRRLVMVALVGQALVALPLAFAGASWAVVAQFAGLSAFGALIRPATASMVPAITGADDATRGYARLALGTGLGFIVGPAAGGVLTGAFGPRTALLANAATFVVLAASWSRLRARRDPRSFGAGAPDETPGVGSRADGSGRAARAGGFRLVRQDPVLRLGIGVAGIAVACAVVDNVAAPFRFIDQLGAGPGGYGTYLSLWGIGGLVGSQLTPMLTRPGTASRMLAVGNLLSGVGVAGIGLAPGLGVAFLAALIGGLGNGAANVSQNTLVSSRVPAASHGRAFSAVGAIIQVAVGVGTAAGAPLVAALDADGAMIAAGGLCTVLAAGHVWLARRPAPDVVQQEIVGPGW